MVIARRGIKGDNKTVRVGDTGEPGRTVTAYSLLVDAERAFLRAQFPVVRPLLQRLRNEFGTPDSDSDTDSAVRYALLRGALAARAGNWPEAVRWCPYSDDLHMAKTGIVHALGVSALRRLSEEGRHTDAGTAAVAIMLWAYLLDEEDPGDFRLLLTERRGTPVPDPDWEEARCHLLKRVADLLHALDVRAGRDVLAAWETVWEVECEAPVVVPSDAGPADLVPVELAARHLVRHGRGAELLHAYALRHPDLGGWSADSPEHGACADALAKALAERGRDRVRAGQWSEVLADFSAAARLGNALRAEDEAAVLRGARNVGRTHSGRGYSPVTRIHGLELAHALLPQNASVAAELTAELVEQGKRVFESDPEQSRKRFARALKVTPRNRDARMGLDEHLKGDMRRAFDADDREATFRVGDVKGLLRRDPEFVPARWWLGKYYVDQAVAAALGGRMPLARAAVRKLLQYDGPTGQSCGDVDVDPLLVDLLVGAARRTDAQDKRGTLERRVKLLSAAQAIEGPAVSRRVREQLDTAVLLLAEHLEATASPSDVIELFLQDRMRTGVSARFDHTVEAAYLDRARERERAGDLGGAQRDRSCAERIGAGLSAQGVLFGRDSHQPRHGDTGQEALF
ncbi:hypothetical protein ACIQ6Y_05385 [Streptomyces sp. NPDC096205]|uniref:hypothetical protein n=1 Tax=Streptomyces sp. NPDC096205 TaxID=3366081 RepID=UPI0037F4CDEB